MRPSLLFPFSREFRHLKHSFLCYVLAFLHHNHDCYHRHVKVFLLQKQPCFHRKCFFVNNLFQNIFIFGIRKCFFRKFILKRVTLPPSCQHCYLFFHVIDMSFDLSRTSLSFASDFFRTSPSYSSIIKLHTTNDTT